MKMLLAIGGLCFAIATAITWLVVRAVRKARGNEDVRGRGEEESRRTAEAQRYAEQDAHLEAQRQSRAKEEAQDAQLRAEEEVRRKAEEARVARESEARRRAEEESRGEAEALRRAEEQARVATEAEAEARRQAEVQARTEAEETRRRAEEEAGRIAEEARLAAEADADSRREAEKEAHGGAEQQARLAAEAQERCRADEEDRLNAEAEARRRTEQKMRRDAEGDAPPAIPTPGIIDVPMARDLGRSAILSAHVPPIRTPRQYRPAARVPAVPAAPRRPESVCPELETRDRALPINVRLLFEKAHFCRVSLLPRRDPGMPGEFSVLGSGDPPEFLALQEEWYQDVVLPSAGHLLREGVEWAAAPSMGQQGRWSLSGREIYVLARHSDLNGFVSTPRLILGEEHVVLCVAERLREVHAAIALTGSPEPTLLNSDSGIPDGWTGLRGVVPRTPIAPSPAGEILDALRPLAEVEIALEGGIRIDRNTWLSGFPPRIRLRGDTSSIGAVTIDGDDATLSADGCYAVPGWDSPGEHSVWCTSGSRTYAIRAGAEDWESWDAYSWSLGEMVGGTQSRPAICGVLVRPPRAARSHGRSIILPASNPVLIGARPGEIEICTPRSDVHTGLCIGFPWFEPIWAIPADALHCDKRTVRVLLIGSPLPVAEGELQSSARPGKRRVRLQHRRTHGAYTWCEAILTAGRKGLLTEPPRAEIADLWKAYKSYAKAIRRSWRSGR